MADLALLTGIEQKYNGPIPPRDRWIIRFGGAEAYRQAKAKSVIRHTTQRAQKILDRWKQAKFDGRWDNRQDRAKSAVLTKILKSEIRVLLTCRAKWVKFLREASKAVDEILIGLLALTSGAASV
jgi:predicted kinase